MRPSSRPRFSSCSMASMKSGTPLELLKRSDEDDLLNIRLGCWSGRGGNPAAGNVRKPVQALAQRDRQAGRAVDDEGIRQGEALALQGVGDHWGEIADPPRRRR